MNEYSLSEVEGGKAIAAQAEEDIYQALELPWIPPELREDRGEFELPETPKDLITLDDIRGDVHLHTVASDGRCSIEEMAQAARQRGYKYICITDHSQSSAIANGLSPERLRQHIDDVRAANGQVKGITIWAGTEVDILADGSLDYEDELLAELDFVVASVHSGLGKDTEKNTRRTIAAVRNPFVNLIGHPTGRMINAREAMTIDIEAVCAAAAETGTALEINANTYRLDLKDQHARVARAHGAILSINCDAHDTAGYDQLRFGVVTARRAGARKSEVLNAWTAKQIEKFVQAKRSPRELIGGAFSGPQCRRRLIACRVDAAPPECTIRASH